MTSYSNDVYAQRVKKVPKKLGLGLEVFNIHNTVGHNPACSQILDEAGRGGVPQFAEVDQTTVLTGLAHTFHGENPVVRHWAGHLAQRTPAMGAIKIKIPGNHTESCSCGPPWSQRLGIVGSSSIW